MVPVTFHGILQRIVCNELLNVRGCSQFELYVSLKLTCDAGHPMQKDVQGAKIYHKKREVTVLHQKYTIKSTRKNRTKMIVSKKRLIKMYVFMAI